MPATESESSVKQLLSGLPHSRNFTIVTRLIYMSLQLVPQQPKQYLVHIETNNKRRNPPPPPCTEDGTRITSELGQSETLVDFYVSVKMCPLKRKTCSLHEIQEPGTPGSCYRSTTLLHKICGIFKLFIWTSIALYALRPTIIVHII